MGWKLVVTNGVAMTIKERFWSKTETSTEHSYNGTPCIDWTACKRNGYGRMGVDGKIINAHRLSYQLEHGDIPSGMCVCHHCDRRCCVNPEHLFLGTYQDNHDDMRAKGRGANVKGEWNSRARLTVLDVVLIKMFLQRHPLVACRIRGGQYNFLGRWFGVASDTISGINTGKRWAHVKVEGVAS